jgi:hypothetical protein
MSERELDVLVAEKVFGLVPCTAKCHDFGNLRPCHAQPNSPDQGAETRRYSTRIEDACMVVEAMGKRGFWARIQSPWDPPEYNVYHAGFTAHGNTGWNGRPDFGVADESVCRAICLAALSSIGEKGNP